MIKWKMESERKFENYEVLSDLTKNDEMKTSTQLNGGQTVHDKENANPNIESTENNIRRHDEPSELSFEICKPNQENSLLLFC